MFHDFKWFNLKAAAAHLPIIQKEVDELHAKVAKEPSAGDALYYNLKQFNHMHIRTFKMHTIQHVWQHIQCGDYAFCIDLKDVYFHIPIVKYHCFLYIVWQNMLYQWKVLTLGLATAPVIFTAITKPILLPCQHKGFHIVIYLDDILVLTFSKWTGRRAHSFLCSLLVHLALCMKFSQSDLCVTKTFCFLSYVGILSICQYLCLLIR